MRFAFSTLGCPELTLQQAVDLAGRAGYDGLELRSGAQGTVNASLTATERAAARRLLSEAGIAAVSVSSYVQLCGEGDDDLIVADAVAEAQLAHDLDAGWVRLFPGGPLDAGLDTQARGRLARIVEATADLDVRLAVETHDSHPSAREAMRLTDGSDPARVGIIWDALHTWRADEAPSDTARILGDRLALIQVKDVASADDLTPLALGDGVLPLRECLDLVIRDGHTEWVSWEYERAWHPQVPPLTEIGAAGRAWLGDVVADAD